MFETIKQIVSCNIAKNAINIQKQEISEILQTNAIILAQKEEDNAKLKEQIIKHAPVGQVATVDSSNFRGSGPHSKPGGHSKPKSTKTSQPIL